MPVAIEARVARQRELLSLARKFLRRILRRRDPQLLGALKVRELLADELGLEGELAEAIGGRGER